MSLSSYISKCEGVFQGVYELMVHRAAFAAKNFGESPSGHYITFLEIAIQIGQNCLK
jgi:hypothetical protein